MNGMGGGTCIPSSWCRSPAQLQLSLCREACLWRAAGWGTPHWLSQQVAALSWSLHGSPQTPTLLLQLDRACLFVCFFYVAMQLNVPWCQSVSSELQEQNDQTKQQQNKRHVLTFRVWRTPCCLSSSAETVWEEVSSDKRSLTSPSRASEPTRTHPS